MRRFAKSVSQLCWEGPLPSKGAKENEGEGAGGRPQPHQGRAWLQGGSRGGAGSLGQGEGRLGGQG